MKQGFITHLSLNGIQRNFTGFNLLQHIFIFCSRERPKGGIHHTHTRVILFLSWHLLGLAIILQRYAIKKKFSLCHHFNVN